MSKKKVLVIDDNPAIVRLDESLLGSQDYEVIKAYDGEEGFQKAQKEKPDIILLDVILPGIHGFELCKKIKENEETKDIPIVIVTASGLEEVAKEEPDIKADAYISKPYGLEELMNVIKNIEGKQG